MDKLNEGYGGTVISTDECGALLVEGIEEWIKGLSIIDGEPRPFNRQGFVLMQDNKTGAKFLIARVEDKDGT